MDFREARPYKEALGELLRAIYGQPHPGKRPLGKNPFLSEGAVGTESGQVVAPSEEKKLNRI
jgi:hypothetical protein